MVRRFFQAVRPGSLPVMTRASYRREVVTSLTFSATVSLVEGGVAGVVAAKVFGASAAQVATITASSMFANLTSLAWARLTRGRGKVACIVAMMGAVLVCVGLIGLLPVDAVGAWVMVGLVVVARCLLAGVVTLRSVVWRQNYPRHMRGRITGYLAQVVGLSLLIVPMLAGVALDADERSFRWVFPLGALVGLIGLVGFAGIRLRGERALLRFESRPGARPTRHGDVVGVYEYDRKQREPSVGMFAVLKRDPLFRRYMVWQFFAGVSNMMVEPVLIFMAARETESLAGGFFVGMALTHGLPVLMMVLTLPAWAARLDRTNIAQFRVEQAWMWTASQLIIWVGAIFAGTPWATITWLAVGRLVLGVARGGGTLAWNLGHNDFASREMVTVYMGIHVTLTGVRGVFAPFLGMVLYSGWSGDSLPGRWLGGFPGMGGHVFLISAALSAVALWGYWELKHRMGSRGGAISRGD